MKKLLLPTGVLLLLCVCSPSLHAQQRTGERIGERIDQAVDKLRSEAKDVAGQVREGFAKVRESVHHMNVAARVYARLHWDKTLYDTDISVDVNRGGVTVLHGSVRTEQARRHAEELAAGTVGVDHVVNELQVVSGEEPRGQASRQK